jgi:hypothetical protein
VRPSFDESPVIDCLYGQGQEPAPQNREAGRGLGHRDPPALRVRIAGALAIPRVPGRLRIDLEVRARRITMLVNAIREMPGPDEADAILYDRLIKRMDRLRELITATNATLYGLAKLPLEAVPQKPAVRTRDWRSSSPVDRPKS